MVLGTSLPIHPSMSWVDVASRRIRSISSISEFAACDTPSDEYLSASRQAPEFTFVVTRQDGGPLQRRQAFVTDRGVQSMHQLEEIQVH